MIAMNGLAFDLSTPLRAHDSDHHRRHHRLQVRADPGAYQVWHCAARARGHRFGRQSGQRPKADRRAPKVLALVAEGRSYHLIGRELGLSKNTVTDIVKHSRAVAQAPKSLE
jgi:DNA-binding CsgD family transcriptional regulator